MQRARKTRVQTAAERAKAQPVSLFEDCKNTKKQGDIGEACAIYEYTKRGYTVCVPLCDSTKYDLIIEKGGIMKRVQVKTTNSFTPAGCFSVRLATTGGNRSRFTGEPRRPEDYDELFVLATDGRRWMIPASDMGNTKYALNVGNSKWKEFEVF